MCDPLHLQIPELLLAKPEGGREENERDTKSKSSGHLIFFFYDESISVVSLSVLLFCGGIFKTLILVIRLS